MYIKPHSTIAQHGQLGVWVYSLAPTEQRAYIHVITLGTHYHQTTTVTWHAPSCLSLSRMSGRSPPCLRSTLTYRIKRPFWVLCATAPERTLKQVRADYRTNPISSLFRHSLQGREGKEKRKGKEAMGCCTHEKRKANESKTSRVARKGMQNKQAQDKVKRGHISYRAHQQKSCDYNR